MSTPTHESQRSGERGATVVEYAVMLSGIAVVLVGAAFAFGGDLTAAWESLSDVVRSF